MEENSAGGFLQIHLLLPVPTTSTAAVSLRASTPPRAPSSPLPAKRAAPPRASPAPPPFLPFFRIESHHSFPAVTTAETSPSPSIRRHLEFPRSEPTPPSALPHPLLPPHRRNRAGVVWSRRVRPRPLNRGRQPPASIPSTPSTPATVECSQATRVSPRTAPCPPFARL